MNYTSNFSQGNTPVWQSLVRCPVNAAGTEESLVNNAGWVADRTDIRTAWLPS